MRRAFVLAALVLLAGALVWMVEAPPRPTGEDAVSGPRLFKMPPAAVERVVVSIGERGVIGERTAHGWTIDGATASAPLDDALTDLVDMLTALRAVDRFRPRDGAGFGLEPPRATLELATRRRRTQVVLGELNAARSAVYARREGSPQVMLVGLYAISALERVLYFASQAPGSLHP